MRAKSAARGIQGASRMIQFGALLATASVAVLGMHATPADAATPETRETQVLEEIVVTATRRESTPFNVAGSLSALSGDYLDQAGFDTFADYAGQVPSLNFVEFAPGRTRITIRGISADPGIDTASTVSVYVDDVPVTASHAGQQIDFRLYDVNRVEVLRGPQGTLFGENSMGGAIRIFTNDPDASDFAATYEAGIGSIKSGGQTYKADGMINLPLVNDQLALRLVGSYRSSDGWIDNITTGHDNVNGHRIRSGRAALSYAPTADFSISLRASVNRLDVDSLSESTVNDEEVTNTLANSPSRDDYEIYSGDIRWNLGFATLESITGYVNRDDTISQSELPVSVMSQNGLFTAFCVFGDPATGCTTPDPAANLLTSSVFTGRTEERVLTQEIHLVSPTDQRLRWILGAFYRDSTADSETHRVTTPEVRFANNAFLPLGFAAGDLVPGGFLADVGRLESDHYAGFGEISFDITPTVELTAGVRHFRESFDYRPTTTTGLLALLGSGFTSFSDVSLPFSSDASDTNVKAALSWKPSTAQHYYMSYSEGFRSGGANGLPTPSPNFTPEYKPDTTENYEVGAKWRFLQGRLELTSALYYTDWANLQVNDFDLNTGVGFIRNGGSAHSEGVELQLAGQLTDGLRFTVGGNWTEAQTDTPIRGSFTPIIASGTRLPNVPQWAYGGSLEYARDIPDWKAKGVVRFDVHGQTYSYSAMERFPATFLGFPLSPKRSLQDGYNIGNIRVGLEDSSWSAFIYVDNVWNEVADLGDNNFGMFHRNQPRTIGVVVNQSF